MAKEKNTMLSALGMTKNQQVQGIANVVVNQIARAPKGTYSDAVESVLKAIEITTKEGETARARVEALKAVAQVRNSDAADVIQQFSDQFRQQNENQILEPEN